MVNEPSPATEPTTPPLPPARPRKPVGMGDVLLGFLYSQVLATIPVIAALFVGMITLARVNPDATPTEATDYLLTFASGGAVIFGAMILGWAGFMFATYWAATHKGDGDWRTLLKWRFKASRDIPIAIAFVVIGRGLEWLALLGLQAAGVDTESIGNTSTILDTTGIWLVLIAIGAVIGAPLVEEIFFRGLFLSVAVRNYGKVAAVILTSVVFGVLHMQATLASAIFTVTSATILGVAFALLVLRTNRLGPAIASHIAFNASGVTLALLVGL